MNIHDLLKPGTVTVITDSPEFYLRWSVNLAHEPDITVVLCEDGADLSAPEPKPRQAGADEDEP